jgi:clorobiocin/coumermycin A biosynthesis protein CloN6/CouN6
MEAWVRRVMAFTVFQGDMGYCIGMPEQDARSVQETVDYCNNPVHKFRGKNITPMICPMSPFLDPVATFFEVPKQHRRGAPAITNVGYPASISSGPLAAEGSNAAFRE